MDSKRRGKQMPGIRPSKWKFKTSGGYGAGALYAAGTLGHLVLTQPKGGEVVFNYVAAGAGTGASINVTASTEDNPSFGKIFLLESFHGADLTTKDFEGWCVIMEASVAFASGAMPGAGNAGSAMFVGIPLTRAVVRGVVKRKWFDFVMGPFWGTVRKLYEAGRDTRGGGVPSIDPLELSRHAKAVLLMDGFGGSATKSSLGITFYYGRLWTGSVSPWGDVKFPAEPPGPQRINFEEVSKDESIITFSGDLLFDFDKSEIKMPFVLAAVGLFIKGTSARRVLIDGHTDSINRSGQPDYNQRLSERRANAVKHFLLSHDFVSPKDVEAKGHGATMPVADNKIQFPFGGPELDNPEGRALNRRVEIRVLHY
jgi:outer membrane protein OmpA-like peptidoglycan-associated protein